MHARLERLPVEIQVSLLCQLDTMSTVFALLQVSAIYLRVYRTHSIAVYSAIVGKHVPPSVLLSGISALNLRKPDFNADVTTFTKVSSAVVDYSKLSLADWKYLYRTHRTVDRMIRDSVAQAFKIVQRDCPTTDPDAFNISLSPTEYHRLLRGFYNWQLLTSICAQYIYKNVSTKTGQPPVNKVKLLKHLDQFHFFVESLTPSELQEIRYVAYYLRQCIYGFLDDAEDDVVQVWKNLGPNKYRHDFEDGKHWIWTSIGRRCQDMWANNTLYSQSLTAVSCLIHRAKPSERIRRVEAINIRSSSSSGAPWKALEAALEHQRDLTITNTISILVPRDWHPGRLTRPDKTDTPYVDDPERYSLGLLWGCASLPVHGPDYVLERMSVWGGAIWDAERLQAMGVLTMQDPEQLAWKEDDPWARSTDDREDFPRRDYSTVDHRVSLLERKWISKGLMHNRWDLPNGCNSRGDSYYGDEAWREEFYRDLDDREVDDDSNGYSGI